MSLSAQHFALRAIRGALEEKFGDHRIGVSIDLDKISAPRGQREAGDGEDGGDTPTRVAGEDPRRVLIYLDAEGQGDRERERRV